MGSLIDNYPTILMKWYHDTTDVRASLQHYYRPSPRSHSDLASWTRRQQTLHHPRHRSHRPRVTSRPLVLPPCRRLRAPSAERINIANTAPLRKSPPRRQLHRLLPRLLHISPSLAVPVVVTEVRRIISMPSFCRTCRLPQRIRCKKVWPNLLLLRCNPLDSYWPIPSSSSCGRGGGQQILKWRNKCWCASQAILCSGHLQVHRMRVAIRWFFSRSVLQITTPPWAGVRNTTIINTSIIEPNVRRQSRIIITKSTLTVS